MSDLAVARRLGRRMNHLLVDQSLFAWTHRILGLIAGSTCVITAIGTTKFLHGSGFTKGFGGSLVAVIFFSAASQFAVSSSTNFDLVDDKFSQTIGFAVCPAGISVLVALVTVVLFLTSYPRWPLLAISC